MSLSPEHDGCCLPASRSAGTIHAILQQVFGYPSFRDQQEDIVVHALSGKDSLVIMPTGGGKSLCFQIPALASTGLTLVISPLIALMEDQVKALRANGVMAAFVNSTQNSREKREILKDLDSGVLKLLYISPEKAMTAAFLQYIGKKEVALVAIDEAHCVSIWGNDFRPEYAALKGLRNQLPNTPFMALTATADKATQLDITKQLDLQNPRVFLSSFERKNINIRVQPGQKRLQQIVQFLDQHRSHAGIIYCLSRKSTMQLAEQLRNRGFNAAHYHARIEVPMKKQVQEAFQRDEIQIICATIAFGMGIDKSNIRWVIHYNLPKNIESYYQEIGRAGRDGAQAEAMLFYSYHDISVFRRFIDESDAHETFKHVQRLKLDRIWEFTQATSCRTNLILNYFGEYRNKPCGHCDICTHPPQLFDGTKYAKMALQICKEAGEKIGMHLLVDALRASGRKEVMQAGLNHLPSYGVGRSIPRFAWIMYITQLVNQGLLEIDYTQHSVLKITRLGSDVVGGSLTIHLSRPKGVQPKQQTLLPEPSEDGYDQALFDQLRTLRKQIADEESVPAYIVFADKVLQRMSAQRPQDLAGMHRISGVGDYKLNKYGAAFLKCLLEYDQSITN